MLESCAGAPPSAHVRVHMHAYFNTPSGSKLGLVNTIYQFASLESFPYMGALVFMNDGSLLICLRRDLS